MDSALCLGQGVMARPMHPHLLNSRSVGRQCHGDGKEVAVCALSDVLCSSSSSGPLIPIGLKLGKTCTSFIRQKAFNTVNKRYSRRYETSIYNSFTQDTMLDEASQMSEAKASLKVFPGKAAPLGVSEVESGINFAIFSKNASSVVLCLSETERDKVEDPDTKMVEIVLDPSKNKTGDIWHICVEGLPRSEVRYGYRIDGPDSREEGHRYDSSNILLDPYAKLVEGRRYFGDSENKISKFYGTYDFSTNIFDWGPDYKIPNIAEKDLVIYEMNVRAFTAHESSGLDASICGSYLGVIEKIPYLQELGVNAVELLPVFEFDEMEFQRRPNPRDHMINTWGYSTINFFAPMSRYASNGGGPRAASYEFKEMVKALHNAGIEVILDVVYNHTNETGSFVTSFRGIDNKEYYMLDFKKKAQYFNFSGCGIAKQECLLYCRGSTQGPPYRLSHREYNLDQSDSSLQRGLFGPRTIKISSLYWLQFNILSPVNFRVSGTPGMVA